MSNIFGDAAGDGAIDSGTAEQVAEQVAETASEVLAEASTGTGGDLATDGGVDLVDLADLLSDAGVDAVWLDLDGDLIPETMVPTDGPFTFEADGADVYDDWSVADSYDIATGELDGESMSILLPFELEAGYPDPFVLPEADWTECGVYDPMTAAPDWTVEGWAEFTDLYAVPGMDAGFADAGDYYDVSTPTAGYWDVDSYFDGAGGHLDASTPIDTWDLPMAVPGAGYDAGAGFDTGMGYDATSSWDPTAGDAQHEAFIDVIQGDYSDPTSSWDPSGSTDPYQFWMDEYDAASDLSWDAWNASVDASIAGDSSLAYDLNQTSLAYESYANDAWSYASDSSAYSTTSSYSADDGWYDAMSLD